MGSLTCTIEPDELLGLRALIELDKATGGGTTSGSDIDEVSKARALLRTALADRLQEAGLPWAPSVEAASRRAAQVAAPAGSRWRSWRGEKARKPAAYAVAAALGVVLWGGYAQGWPWTGLQDNGQLWDWLNLLLLPVVLGTIPVWLQYNDYIGKGRRALYTVVIVAWTGFVIAGYVIPLRWTGFPGQTLWDWLTLLVLPAAVAITMALLSRPTQRAKIQLRPFQQALAAAVAAGWIVTIIGGYALRWNWTGYAGNTLWDWLRMLLPIVFPVILLPPLLTWISGNAAGRARAAQETTVATAGTAGPTSP